MLVFSQQIDTFFHPLSGCHLSTSLLHLGLLKCSEYRLSCLLGRFIIIFLHQIVSISLSFFLSLFPPASSTRSFVFLDWLTYPLWDCHFLDVFLDLLISFFILGLLKLSEYSLSCLLGRFIIIFIHQIVIPLHFFLCVICSFFL